MNLMLIGAVAMANVIASLFFLRFWRTTRDRFFLFFGIAFGIEALGRILLGFAPHSEEHEPLFYLIRLFAFAMILFAIIDKNRKQKQP